MVRLNSTSSTMSTRTPVSSALGNRGVARLCSSSSSNQNMAPPSGASATAIVPPIISTNWRQIDRPSPVPP